MSRRSPLAFRFLLHVLSPCGALLLAGCGQAALSERLDTIEKSFDGELHIYPPALPQGTVGAPYRASIEARGGQAPYEWLVVYGALPAGLRLDRSSGVIDGVPSAAGEASFVVYVRAARQSKDSVVGWRVRTTSINVAPPAPPPSEEPALPAPANEIEPGGAS